MSYEIERTIEIDAGHRVPTHGSKCCAPHGHRYKIVAVCQLVPELSLLPEEGEQAGMVLDFGFLKEEMVRLIHDPCDHAFIYWIGDGQLRDSIAAWLRGNPETRNTYLLKEDHLVGALIERAGNRRVPALHLGRDMKLYVLDGVPTAENLAKHWFHLLAPAVTHRSDQRASLTKLVVHETPNSVASYSLHSGGPIQETPK